MTLLCQRAPCCFDVQPAPAAAIWWVRREGGEVEAAFECGSCPQEQPAHRSEVQLQLVTHPSKPLVSSQFMVLVIICLRAAAVATASLQRVL